MRSGLGWTFGIWMGFAVLASCEGPTRDSAMLRAIKAEAETLASTHPILTPNKVVHVPRGDWPPAIARLHPEWVTVHRWGVDILIRPYFDGGWGYQVARSRRDLPMLDGCYVEPGPGVFWHGPC